MSLKGEVGGHAYNSHGNYIVDHGKSWKNHGIVFLNFCGNPDCTSALSLVLMFMFPFTYSSGPLSINFLIRRVLCLSMALFIPFPEFSIVNFHLRSIEHLCFSNNIKSQSICLYDRT